MTSGLRILYFGPTSGTCRDRALAYERLGHTVTHINPKSLLPQTPWVERITWKLGGQWFGGLLGRALSRELAGLQFDLCHVDGGEWFTESTLNVLRWHARLLVNYNIDDPTGPRDGRRYTAYRHAISLYDLAVVMRAPNVDELARLGMRRVLRVFMCSDEQSHRPRLMSPDDQTRWGCDVLFLGTWMPERGPFLLHLIQAGIPLTIRGDHWEKAPEWSQLKAHWKGGSLADDDYAKAIQGAKVNLGLLSKGNRDQHTTRSMEIPALGGLLCAERTDEHLSLYAEGNEALFWSTPEECVQQCQIALKDPELARLIAERGHAAHVNSEHTNERMLARILQTLKLDHGTHSIQQP